MKIIIIIIFFILVLMMLFLLLDIKIQIFDSKIVENNITLYMVYMLVLSYLDILISKI
jgi:hypothetical protein